MATTARFSEVASLAGDPARASMLHALMDGRALTAGELAIVAGITPQTASGHLARLTAAGLVRLERQGRHRYHRLASAEVAGMLESIMCVASALDPAARRHWYGPRDEALRAARTCYDHLAGRLGVLLADALIGEGEAAWRGEGAAISAHGMELLARLKIDVDGARDGSVRRARRVLCRPCLDWSERRTHLAGAIGAAICQASLERGWVRRQDGTRALTITAKGRAIYRDTFGIRDL